MLHIAVKRGKGKIDKTEARRQAITQKMADYMLEHGLQNSSLRKLAAAAGTSDRMLLHYFTNKEELLSATLVVITERLVALLDGARAEPMPFETLLTLLAVMIKDERVQPYLRLYLELVAFAAGGEEFYRQVAGKIADIFLDWYSAALEVEREEDRLPMASLAFATVEGFILLDAVGRDPWITEALRGIEIR